MLRFISITTLATVILTGCNFGLMNLQVDDDGNGQVTLTLSAGMAEGRTVTAQPEDIPIVSYKLTATKGETTLTETFADLSTAKITLEKGNWSFVLNALDSGGNLLLIGSLAKTIEAPENLTFTMVPLITESGTGRVEVTIIWPGTSATADTQELSEKEKLKQPPGVAPVSAVTCTLGGREEKTADIADGIYTYTITETDVSSTSIGTLLVVKLKDSNDKTLTTVTGLVRVYDNLTSRKTISLSAADFNGTPVPPSALTATLTAGTTTVNLSWTDNSTNESGFEIQYSDDGGSTWNALTTAAAGSTSYNDTVPRGTTRSYRMQAMNDLGESDYSEASAAITVPRLLTLTYNGNGNSGGNIPAAATTYEEGTEVTVLGNTGSLVIGLPEAGTAEAFKGFGGWNTKADGSGIAYVPGNIFTITEDTTLYAEWGPFEIGDTGPAGGLIFYDKGSFTDNWRYLEAAPTNINGQEIWDNPAHAVLGAEGTAIGTGRQNTADIITYGYYEENNAAHDCDGYSITVNEVIYEDWFLPSKDELNAMYTNLHVKDLGGFTTDQPTNIYWSSSEDTGNTNNAWSQLFRDGTPYSQVKSQNFYIRPVRAF